MLDDCLLDTLQFECRPSRAGRCPVRLVNSTQSPAPAALRNLLDYLPSRRLPAAMQALQQRQSFATEEEGFDFLPETGTPATASVTVYDFIRSTAISRPAFERLMARYFTALVQTVQTQQDALLDAPWWPALIADVGRLATSPQTLPSASAAAGQAAAAHHAGRSPTR